MDNYKKIFKKELSKYLHNEERVNIIVSSLVELCNNDTNKFKTIAAKILCISEKNEDVIMNSTTEEILNGQAWDLLPKEWKIEINNHTMQAKLGCASKISNSSIYVCKKCKSNKTSYFERQDRSADEGMTVHITCCNCGQYWRE